MRRSSRIVGMILLLFGLMPLFSSLNKPRLQTLHGSARVA
jgi:hypothetical protein